MITVIYLAFNNTYSINVVYIGAGGVASPSLMPEKTVGSPTHRQWIV